ncbi:MAG TPA: STAS domain-containing protein [Acidimicrobiia bacterium]
MTTSEIGKLELEHHGPVLVARIKGEVDLSNVDEMGATIMSSVTPDMHGLVIDLTDTTFLGSTGVRMLFELADRLRARRHHLRLVADQSALVRRVLVLSELDNVVPIDADLSAALTAAAADR